MTTSALANALNHLDDALVCLRRARRSTRAVPLDSTNALLFKKYCKVAKHNLELAQFLLTEREIVV